MNAGPLSEPSDVVGTGLGDRSYREWDSPEDVDCSASLPSQSVLRGGSLTRSPLPPSGIPLSPLWTDSKVLARSEEGRRQCVDSWVPFPTTGTEQMLSHGSADVVVEACTDFWDGADIYPLSGSDR